MKKPIITVKTSDCEMQVFRAGGKGGQKQNKTSSGVRFIHHPSGARGESREERSQLANKKNAFRRLAESEKMQKWLRMETMRKAGHIEAAVDRAMAPENLLIEIEEGELE